MPGFSSESPSEPPPASGEFSLIRDYFTDKTPSHPQTVLGIGDDAAILEIPENHQLVASIDTMVEGIHFFPDVSPELLGHKILTVNLSDLAAMGAEPAWVTLALALPENDADWLESFQRGFFTLAKQFGVELIGGDTTRCAQGSRTLTVQAHGFVPNGKAARRDGAKPGDLIYVTGQLGEAGLALQLLQKMQQKQNLTDSEKAVLETVRPALERPIPQVEAGQILRKYATAMIDISDGLLADLEHILERSKVGATLDLTKVPCSPHCSQFWGASVALQLALQAGDEYQLCFTISPENVSVIQQKLAEIECTISMIGKIEAGDGITFQGGTEKEIQELLQETGGGYRHF